ncbi:Uncharacterized protein Rs2_40097 [Raphanus sativus]|nr:Uncharacterized protein Rs2_40097 [Raphanus sativus]
MENSNKYKRRWLSREWKRRLLCHGEIVQFYLLPDFPSFRSTIMATAGNKNMDAKSLVRNVIVAWLLCTTGVLLLPLLSLTLLIKGSFERAKNWVQGSFERAKNWVQELQVQEL